jgi:hypothetical protein
MIAQIVWCVLLFRHPGCFKVRVGENKLVYVQPIDGRLVLVLENLP